MLNRLSLCWYIGGNFHRLCFPEQEVTSKWTQECSLRFIRCNWLVLRYSWHPTYWSVTSGLILIMSFATSLLRVRANNNPPSHAWQCLTQSGSEDGLTDGPLSVCWWERRSRSTRSCSSTTIFTIVPIFLNIANETLSIVSVCGWNTHRYWWPFLGIDVPFIQSFLTI